MGTLRHVRTFGFLKVQWQMLAIPNIAAIPHLLLYNEYRTVVSGVFFRGLLWKMHRALPFWVCIFISQGKKDMYLEWTVRYLYLSLDMQNTSLKMRSLGVLCVTEISGFQSSGCERLLSLEMESFPFTLLAAASSSSPPPSERRWHRERPSSICPTVDSQQPCWAPHVGTHP